jgi:hypothetical protein
MIGSYTEVANSNPVGTHTYIRPTYMLQRVVEVLWLVHTVFNDTYQMLRELFVLDFIPNKNRPQGLIRDRWKK